MTEQEAEQLAEESLPHQGRMCDPTMDVSGNEHTVYCPARYRSAVVQALRDVAEREYARGLNAAARLVEGFPVINADAKRTANQIRALATGEQT